MGKKCFEISCLTSFLASKCLATFLPINGSFGPYFNYIRQETCLQNLVGKNLQIICKKYKYYGNQYNQYYVNSWDNMQQFCVVFALIKH